MRSARLLIDAPAAGSWNMAVDQALLESVSRTGAIVLRFYRWEQATLSLGYFQHLEQRESHLPSLHCPVVRRSTGGGAIVHDQELTYSLAVPSGDRWSKAHARLYWMIHGVIIEVLAANGVEAKTFPLASPASPKEVPLEVGCSSPNRAPPSETLGHNTEANTPFLCLQRRSPGDIIVDGFKICGSAQRRKHNSVLQHGSILLRRSPHAPELPGIEDLSSSRFDDLGGTLIEPACQRIGDLLGVPLIRSELHSEEAARASEIEQEFVSKRWLQKLRNQPAQQDY
jgi:lipoate-protein ligase A